jgi:hypothetical protein
VPLGDGESLAALFAQHRVLDILDSTTSENEPIRQNKTVSVAELAVE